MSRDPRLYLEDILEACERIDEYVSGLNQERFTGNRMAYDAVVRNLEIVGEAAKHLPDEIRAVMPEIEWRKAAGLRDMLAHAYFGIDDDILWSVVRDKLPGVRTAVKSYLERR